MRWTWCLVAVLALVGCVELDVTEEVWIEPDGRVRVRMETRMRAPFPPPDGSSSALAGEEARLRAVPGARVSRRVERLRDGLSEVLEAELPGLPGSLEAGARAALIDLGGGRWRFVSRFEPKRAGKARRDADPAAQILAAKLLEGSTWRLVLHAPRVASSDGRVDAAGTTVEWECPILGLAEHGFHGEAEIELPGAASGSAPWIALLALLVLGGVGAGLAVRRVA